MVLSPHTEKPVPTHHRKRQAQHHKRNKDYDKHYWPFLPMLFIASIGLGLNILWTPLSSAFIQQDVLSYAVNTSLVGLLDETNGQRSGNGVGGLQLNGQLNQAAQAKAEDMVARNYWSHTTPDGKEPWQFITSTGYSYQTVGENLAYGFSNSTSTVTGWMNSPGHRANLLNANFQDVGFGIANSPDYLSNGQQTIVVAMYGKTAQPAAVAASAPITAAKAAVSQAAATAPSAQDKPTVASAATPAPTEDQQLAYNATMQVEAVVPETNRNAAALETHRITRLETVAASVPAQSVAAVFAVLAAAVALFVYRHLRALHRVVLHGEKFVLRHPYLDVSVAAALVISSLLTRTAGFIN